MRFNRAFFDTLQVYGTAIHDRALARDDAYLQPVWLSGAAAARLRAAIGALESWVRRVLLVMALAMEGDLVPSAKPWVRTAGERHALRRPGVRVFASRSPLDPAVFEGRSHPYALGRSRVRAAPLLARLARLKALVDRPEARARRLAWCLARRRPGRLWAPVYRGGGGRRHFGTEAGAIHDGLAVAIAQQGAARPPHLGPAIRAGPRIRTL